MAPQMAFAAITGSGAAIHANVLRHLDGLLSELSTDVKSSFERAEVDPRFIGRAALPIGYPAFVKLLSAIAEESSCPDIGMRLASRQRGCAALGPLGTVMRHSETVGEAIHYCVLHAHAFSPALQLRLRPDHGRNGHWVMMDLLLDCVTDTRQAVEHFVALAADSVVDASGAQANARVVSFRHAAMQPLADYRDRFGCDVQFGQEHDGLFLSTADFGREQVDADPQLLAMATLFIESRHPRRAPPLHANVRGLVLGWLSRGDCTSDKVAASLCLHPRTLQRRLRNEGTSFDQIRDEVRRDVARQHIEKGDLPLALIAEKLGYAESSVLSRSCHRWFAASPLQMRRRSTIATRGSDVSSTRSVSHHV